jgi:hypothetical protein
MSYIVIKIPPEADDFYKGVAQTNGQRRSMLVTRGSQNGGQQGIFLTILRRVRSAAGKYG